MEEKKGWLKFVPGGIYTTSRLFGGLYLIKLILKSAYDYFFTFFYILFKRGPQQAYSFFYTKFFVPAGEGAGAGFYFFFNGLIRKFPWLAPFPRYVEIEVTTICPRKCIMCEHTYWKDQEEKHLSFTEFKHIVDNFKGIRWLHLTGEGSSFMNPEYVKMLEYAKSKNICVYLVDTFDMVNEEILQKLVDLQLEGIYLSVDGATKKTYEEIRVGCSFERVTKNINRFLEIKKEKKSRLPEVNFRYVVLKNNKDELPQFVDYVNSFDKSSMGRGARLDFAANLEFEAVKNLSPGIISDSVLKETMEKAKKNDVNVFFSHLEAGKNPDIHQCIAWMEPYVIMGGFVMPCCSILMSNSRTVLRKHALGNIFEKSMKEIWNSERYVKFRNTVNDPKAKVPFMCTLCRAYDFQERLKKYGVDETL
jgi:MoaA/NifB/PqqE/SkfB family radical SAM enzyme